MIISNSIRYQSIALSIYQYFDPYLNVVTAMKILINIIFNNTITGAFTTLTGGFSFKTDY